MWLLSTRSAQFHNNVMHQNRHIEPDSPDEAEDAKALLKACNIRDVQRYSPMVEVHCNVGECVAQPRPGGIRDYMFCMGADKSS